MTAARGTTLDRLADKFTVGDGCWEWSAGRNDSGYGMFWNAGQMQRAHRVVYELLSGPIPAGLTLDHLCRNRGCVRPDHLEPVSRGENVRRGTVGQVNRERMLAKPDCKRGHPLPEQPDSSGRRVCLECNRAKCVAYRARRQP